MILTPLGDQALQVIVADEMGETAFAQVQQVTRVLENARLPGVRELVPSFTTVGVFLEARASLAVTLRRVQELVDALPVEAPVVTGREREIPVCYGGDFGPDLEHVAAQAKLSVDEVIALHARTEYRVHAVGFSPGFPYLAGLPSRLHTPRRANPRTRVPAGSVAIGGAQTGIYPQESPGGWHVIGRTPHLLFEPRADPPAWLQRGDRVRFRPIDRETFARFAAGAEEARRSLLAGTHPPFDRPPAIDVIRPGIFTTIQDLGRPGWQAQGVPPSGALDPLALRCANLLVGNPPDAAGLEWVMRGPVLQFREDRLVVVLGAAPGRIEPGRPWLIRAGETLDLTHLGKGMRGYLAVGGGIDVPVVLGSRSTSARAHFGGYRGRALRAGDALPVGPAGAVSVSGRWRLAPELQPHRTQPVQMIRVVRGPQADQFDPAAWPALVGSAFVVRAEFDRMGLRLDGPRLERPGGRELVSAPVATGAIQVPPEGRPIILLADRQTLGGYPQLGYVITADLPLLAQAGPGARLQFREVSLEEAEFLRHEQERAVGLLALGVKGKLGTP